MYLLDTKVIFELRKPRPHGAVLAWLQAVDNANLQLASVSLGEIQAGIEITREQSAAPASGPAKPSPSATSLSVPAPRSTETSDPALLGCSALPQPAAVPLQGGGHR